MVEKLVTEREIRDREEFRGGNRGAEIGGRERTKLPCYVGEVKDKSPLFRKSTAASKGIDTNVLPVAIHLHAEVSK